MEWLRGSRWRIAGVVGAVAIAVAAVTVAIAATATPDRPAQRVVTATRVPPTQPPTTPAPSSTPLPTLAPLTSPSTDAPAGTSPTTTAGPPASTSTTGEPAPCVKDQLSVDAAPDHADYAVGQPVLLTLTLVDTGAVACTVTRPAGWATVSVSRGRTPTWAGNLPDGSTLRLEPRQAVFAGSLMWSQNQCEADPCGTSGPPAPTGTYELLATVRLGATVATSARVTFTIGAPPTTTTPSTSVPPSTAPATGA